ncbi:Apoptosis-inducing factor-like protein [Smittium culicis]|uniref:Apoptosis-inducing factor-like protein n=1 Tax=Smittium culicis TaxID=133412 RepID=A0A1R1YDB2_9FUNG|nr:Apoptosis-inducing factor-like protein [Smittium culicis]
MKYDDQCAAPPLPKINRNSVAYSNEEQNKHLAKGVDVGKKSLKSRFGKLFGRGKSGSPEIGDNLDVGMDNMSISGKSMTQSNYSMSVFSTNLSIVSENTSSNAMNIVIIGCSIAGLYSSKYLEKNCGSGVRITIIEPNERLYFKPGSFSACFDTTLAPHLSIPLNKLFKYSHNKLKTDRVTKVFDDYVETENGETIYYDALVIASGGIYSCPNKMTGNDVKETTEKYKVYFKELHRAKSLLILGGGPTGVELALRAFKEKNIEKITIVHDECMILDENYSEAYRKKIQSKLEIEGVELLLNDKAKIKKGENYGYPVKGRWLETESGKMIFSDIQVDCTGITASSDFMMGLNTDHNQVTDKDCGFIRVNRYLQVIGHPKMFAIGDVNNIGGLKVIERAKSQAETVATTIYQWLKQYNKGSNTITSIEPCTWSIDSEMAYLSIKNNELDEDEEDNGFHGRKLLNESMKSKVEPEIKTRKADDLKTIYKLLGLDLKNRSSF